MEDRVADTGLGRACLWSPKRVGFSTHVVCVHPAYHQRCRGQSSAYYRGQSLAKTRLITAVSSTLLST